MSGGEHEPKAASGGGLRARDALRFVIVLGTVSLFADLCYEGGRSLAGPYLSMLGASAAAVGIAAGLGEFAGYALRLASGYAADRVRAPWVLVFLGYSMSVVAVPLMALAPNWQVAAALLVVERLGKAVRAPARDSILAGASEKIGQGKGFGIHEAMDQIGAVAGPLLAAGVLAAKGRYDIALAVFAVPAALCVASLLLTRRAFSRLGGEPRFKAPPHAAPLPRAAWVCFAGCALVAFGTPDFALLSYHFKDKAVFEDGVIPLLYAGAMGVDALAALGLGTWFDRRGVVVLALASALGAGAAPLCLLGGPGLAIAGMVLWGIALSSQESVMRAMVAKLAPPDRRGWTFGVFNVVFGVAWLAGSALVSVLYERSPGIAAGVAAGATVLSVPLFWRAGREQRVN